MYDTPSKQNLKRNWYTRTYLQNGNRLTDLENKPRCRGGVGRGKEYREGIVRKFVIDIYTLLYLKWITNKVLLYSTRKSAQCCVAARMGAEFGGECIHVYVQLSPFAVHLKLSHHC